ncbi:hypothetical protein BAUCODRAFT_60763 [Baudoinia panamericana UAMH 10762]|uniref:Fumarylacetoacetase n=1 Tax=Baudoinia panamericana (strain UAMH 10762) TaxID=717646 RepID=M2NMU8_BAUPA|nr:uncharacterized protein BAUCODRAFT_60763 [Baudoinia panamericana UAMH 10762]EMD00516.1 hypothetical protein BAUCODRAFT_60763 [Baudoinia panamericana UAMH 10762]
MASSSSWLDIDEASEFSLANLPFGIVSRAGCWEEPRPAIALGTYVVSLRDLAERNGFAECPDAIPHLAVFTAGSLNNMAAIGRPFSQTLRTYIRDLLVTDTPYPHLLRDNHELRSSAIQPRKECQMHMPMEIGDYTDFYVGLNHAYNVGVLFRGPQNALQPNYTHLPVGYHGRASTVRISGAPVRRPRGQILPMPGATEPIFAASRKLDVELELAAFVCRTNGTDGRPIPIAEAEQYIFGFVLMNDWSARDIQAFEYVPLGPFNSKNFCTTISPWVVTVDALEPFRCDSRIDAARTQKLLPYLDERRATGRRSFYDIRLEMVLTPAQQGNSGLRKAHVVTNTNAANLLFSFPQMLAHHSVGGCEMRVGDLLGSGTISGPDTGSMGSLLEITENGKTPLTLGEGISRCFLEDGDEVNIKGVAGQLGAYVGFGDCSGIILAANNE